MISCGEEEETPCCPESGCLQIHGPSYHCVGGDTPGYTIGATPPVMDSGSLTIEWPRGEPASRSYFLSSSGYDRATAYVDEAVQDRAYRAVASVLWTEVDVDADGNLRSLRGTVRLCDGEAEEERRDENYPEWDLRGWRCGSSAADTHPSRLVEIVSTSLDYETTSVGARLPRATLAMKSEDETINGIVTMRWNPGYEVPAKYEPPRCVDY